MTQAPDTCRRCGRDLLHMPDRGNYCCCLKPSSALADSSPAWRHWFRDRRTAENWIASEADFKGWRYTLDPLLSEAAVRAALATPPAAATSAKWAMSEAEYDRMVNGLMAQLGEISEALGISEEDQSCANGNDAILAAIEELKQEAGDSIGFTREQWVHHATRVYLACGDTEAEAGACAEAIADEQDWHDELDEPYEMALADIEGRPARRAAATRSEPARMRANLDTEEATLLADFLSKDDDGESPPTMLWIGTSPDGYGLHASLTEYPEEGCVLITSNVQPPAAATSTERERLFAEALCAVAHTTNHCGSECSLLSDVAIQVLAEVLPEACELTGKTCAVTDQRPAAATSTPCASGEGEREAPFVPWCANCGKEGAEIAGDYPEEERFCSKRCRAQHDELGCPSEGSHSGFRHPEETERLIACERLSATQAPAVPARPPEGSLSAEMRLSLLNKLASNRGFKSAAEALASLERTPTAGNTEDARSMGAADALRTLIEAIDTGRTIPRDEIERYRALGARA